MRVRKFILPLFILLIGLVVGYFVGVKSKNAPSIDVATNKQTESVKVVHDTIVTEKIITQPKQEVEKVDSIVDSVFVKIITLDTLSEKFLQKPKDTLTDDLDKIKSDKMIASKKVKIEYVDNANIDADSTLKNALNIKEIYPNHIIIEFWESPLNYNGYKLSKSKLIVFGLSPQLDYRMYKTSLNFILNTEDIYYQLNETLDFVPLQQIGKPTFIND